MSPVVKTGNQIFLDKEGKNMAEEEEIDKFFS